MARYTKILKTKAINKLSKDTTVQQRVYQKSKEIFDPRKRQMLETLVDNITQE